jgi:hypothetical protein
MKLMMIGGRGVGKTTLLYAMYDHFRVPRSGLRFKAEDPASVTELERGADLLRKGAYPPATLRRETYSFNLYHDGEEVFDFSWIDYSGRWLTQKTEAANAEQLKRDLGDCDGLFVFLEGARFPAHRDPELRQTIQVLNATLTRSEQFIPVVFVITKSDASPQGYDRDFYESSLRSVLANIERSQSVAGAVIPVSCGRSNRDVDLPMLYFLSWVSLRKLHIYNYYINTVAAKIEEYERKGWWGRLRGEFDGSTDELRKQFELAKVAAALMERLGGALGSMNGRLEKVKSY